MTDTGPATGERVRCEARRLCDNQPCPHPAKYLAPYDSSAVCGIHARAFLRCIPIAEIEQPHQNARLEGDT